MKNYIVKVFIPGIISMARNLVKNIIYEIDLKAYQFTKYLKLHTKLARATYTKLAQQIENLHYFNFSPFYPSQLMGVA